MHRLICDILSHRFLTKALFVFQFLILFSCSQISENKKIEIPNDVVFDTTNVDNTFEVFDSYSVQVRDTLYNRLFNNLINNNDFDLLEKHLKHFQSKLETKSASDGIIYDFYCNIFFQKGSYDSLGKYVQLLNENAVEYNDSSLLAKSELINGIFNFYSGNYEVAYKLFESSANIFITLNDSDGLMNAYSNMALSYNRSGQFDKSIKHYLKIKEFYEPKNDKQNLADTYVLLADAYRALGAYDSSDYYLDKSIDYFRQIGNSLSISITNNNRAINKMNQGLLFEALAILNDNLAFIYASKVAGEYAPTLYNLSLVYSRLNRFELAIEYANRCIQTLDSIGQLDMRTMPMSQLSKIYEKMGNYEEALNMARKTYRLKDSLNTEASTKRIEELNVRFETQEKEAKLNELNEKARNEFYVRITLFLGILILILIIAFIYFRNLQSKRIYKFNLDLKEQELHRLSLEIEFNKKQLQLFTENISNKGKLVSNLEKELNVKADAEEVKKQVNEADIQSLSSQKIFTQEDWVKFKLLFDNVFPGLYSKLIKQFPQLTAGEQRLFLLTKLEIESREIANMLAISPESIRKARYRLKKKLNLEEGETFESLVKNFK